MASLWESLRKKFIIQISKYLKITIALKRVFGVLEWFIGWFVLILIIAIIWILTKFVMVILV